MKTKWRMFTVAAFLSLGVWLAALGFWARSWKTYDTIWRSNGGGMILVRTYRGHLAIDRIRSAPVSAKWTWASAPPQVLAAAPGDTWAIRGGHSQRLMPWLWLGVEMHNGVVTLWTTPRSVPIFLSGWGVDIEVPSLLLPAILLPMAWAIISIHRRRRWRERILQGLCRNCGYDLRATPDRCPECGSTAGGICRGLRFNCHEIFG